MGTPSYMPPEQARGEVEKLGPHSDVYAVGARLNHLRHLGLSTDPPALAPARAPPEPVLA